MIEEITADFQENTGLEIVFHDSVRRKNGIATICGERFVADTEPTISRSNQNITLQRLKELSRENDLPVLLITKYIPAAIAKQYENEGINHIDAAGNCSVRQGSLRIIVEGKKIERLPRTNRSRAFQEAGIRLTYFLLNHTDNVNKPYRELADMAQISLGSVSAVFQELMELKYILPTKKKKVIKNKPELLNRWVIAYNDVLRPRLFLKRMNFTNQSESVNWSELPLQNIPEKTIWGGECAAFLLTKNITPLKYTIYTTDTWQNVGKTMNFVPDPNGKIEVYRLFYKPDSEYNSSPLLTYADLMGSGDSRNIETAEKILDNDLQHLK
jgi:hypothetical protein